MRASILDPSATSLRTRIVNPYPEDLRFIWDGSFAKKFWEAVSEATQVPAYLLVPKFKYRDPIFRPPIRDEKPKGEVLILGELTSEL